MEPVGRRFLSLKPKIARSCLKNNKQVGCWWLTSIKLATWEDEIGRIKV
jgi:hypothetical protein